MSITVTVTPPRVVPAITAGATVQVTASGDVSAGTIGSVLRISVANIDDPSAEMAAVAGVLPKGTIRIAYQTVAGADATRIYWLDDTSSDAASTPNRIDRAAGGQWVLIGGKGVNSSWAVNGALTVGGTASITGAATVGGTLGVTGAATLASAAITGAATIGTTLAVTGAVTLSSTLSAGASTLASAAITGAATIGTTLAVTGAATLSNTLTVTGSVTGSYFTATGFNNAAHTLAAGGVAGTCIITGTGSTYDFSLQTTAGSQILRVPTGTRNVQIPENATVAGTFGVTGAATLSSTLGVTGAATFTASIVSNSLGSILEATQATTAAKYVRVSNTGATLYFGTEASVAGTFFTGSVAYDSCVWTAGRLFLRGATGVEINGAATMSSTLGITGLATFNAAQAAIFNNAAGSYCTWQHNGTSVGDIGPANQIVASGATADLGISSRNSQLVLGTNAVSRITIAATGAVTFASTSPLTVSSTTASTSPTTGALIVNGGAGFSGRVFTTASDFHHFAVPSGSVQMRLERTATAAGSAYIGGDSSGFNVYAQATSQKRMVVDDTAVAGQTALLIYDVDNLTLERVTVGAADSGGVGFKLLRIPN